MTQHQKKPYDSTLKALFREQTAEMLPHLLSGARFIEELNTEILKPQPPLRADKIYKVQYRHEPHVLQIELETKSNSKMAYRMLSYHALLFGEYNMPVISMIIYPFKTTIAKSPLIEKSGRKRMLTFHFMPFPLWEQEAERYIQRHVISMYPLLPTMQGATAPLLLRAIAEMKERYEGQKLSHRLLWFRTLLKRVKTISSEDKARVEEEIDMFDELLDDDPYLKKRDEHVAERAALQAFQTTVLEIVKGRFPSLAQIAEQRVGQIHNRDSLLDLARRLPTAPNEEAALWLLDSAAA